MKNRDSRKIIRTVIDVMMTVLLLCLMAYQITDESLHEWIGIAMTVILIIHHVLNIRWYAVLFKGKYNAYRIATTVVNTLLLVSIALTALSGMSMSNHAVPFLYGLTGMIFARRAHLALSYWSFVLMGVHIGLHLPVITSGIRFGKKTKAVLSVLFMVTAGIGLWLFIKNGILSYMLFREHFVSFDHDKSAVTVILENLMEMIFFVFVGSNVIRFKR